MPLIIALILIGGLVPLAAQGAASPDVKQPAVTAPASQDYVCPMDPDVRSDKPGVCPRCGMKLVLGISDRILVLHHGELLAEGTPLEVRQNEAVKRVYLGQREH